MVTGDRQVVPYTTQAPIGSTDPLDHYKYLEEYEARTNGAAITFAHNGIRDLQFGAGHGCPT